MKQKYCLLGAIVIMLIISACANTEDIADLIPPTLLSPTPGATVTNNPPTFIWGAVEGDSCDLVYRLEVATDSTFVMNSIVLSTMITLPDTTFTPEDAFATGTHYWHMCTRQNA